MLLIGLIGSLEIYESRGHNITTNEALGYDKRGNCLINSENFKSHFMVPVALSSDRTINLHHNLQEVVDFKVLINFDGPTPADQVLMIYSSAEKLIQIDLERNIEIIQ